jgi:hypothetical protein
MKTDRQEKSLNKKLRAGMIKRLRADPLVQKLLVEDAASPSGILVCEALIQQNGGDSRECEVRVNVNSESVEAIGNAILTHCEDNLDILEVLLNMPYLPRNHNGSSEDSTNCNKEETVLKSLSDRAFLRILEDAMFDACEKEGEEEILDDLNLSDVGNGDDVGERVHQKGKKTKC